MGGAALVFAMATALAEPAAAEFRWDAPPGCPSEDEVVATVERTLERSLAEVDGRHISVIARARPGNDGWDLKVWTVTLDETRERTLQTTDCATAAEAAAVFAAMAIDPPPVTEEPEPPVEPKQTPESPPEPVEAPPKPRPEPQPEPAPAPTVELHVAALAGPSWGSTPGVAGLAGVMLSAQRKRFRAEVDVRYGFTQQARYANRPTVGAELQQAFVVVRGCGLLRPDSAVQLPLCGGIEAGALVGRGRGVERARTDSIPWLAVQARTGLLGWVHPRIGLSVGVEPFVALYRPAFRISPVGVLWRPEAAGVRGMAGVEIRL